MYTMNNPFEHILLFNLLNNETKRQVARNTQSVLEIIVSILYFGNPSQTYMKGLIGIAGELVESVLIDTTSLYPVVKRDSTFLNILDRFNKLQKEEEKQVLNTMNRIYNKYTDSTDPATVPVPTLSAKPIPPNTATKP